MENEMINSTREPIGRIEVAPEVLTTIARFATLSVEGVSGLGVTPGEKGHPFRRGGHEGVELEITGDNRLNFDVYVLMDPHVNIMETSRKLQSAVVEAMNKMIGLEVQSVNIHVEDVVYEQGEAA